MARRTLNRVSSSQSLSLLTGASASIEHHIQACHYCDIMLNSNNLIDDGVRVYAGAMGQHVVTNVGNSRERTKQDHSSATTAADLHVNKANFPDTGM